MPPKRKRLTKPPKSHGAAAKKAKAELAKTMEEAHVKPPSPHSKSKRGLEGRKKVQPNTPKSELIARLQEGTEFTDGGVSSDVAAAQWTDMRVQSAVSVGGGSAVAKQVSDGGGSSEEEEGEDSAQDKLRICPSAFECHSDDCDGLWRMPEKKDVRDAHDVRNGNKIQSKSSVYQARCGTCHAVFGPTPAEQKMSRKKKKKAMDAQGRAEHTRTANERTQWRVHYKLPPLLHGKKAATTEAATAEAATADASSEHARDAGDDEEDHASSDAEPSDLKEAKEGHAQHSDALKWDAKKNARWTAGN